MDLGILIFLSSGLFLGWSLGANDAANVFGSAVGSRMIRFGTAAVICSAFALLGAVISGAGAAHGLGKLGAVNALGGAFTVALAAAVTVYLMTKAGLPVSTTQAIVGSIVGWNLFSGSVTDVAQLSRIVGTWVACPILGAIFGASIYKLTAGAVRRLRLHLLRQDFYTRFGLVLAGAFGSYSLGANNIGNVMGVFVPSSPFTGFEVAGLFTFSSVQQLFTLGAIAIGVGVFTYSKRVMLTVGSSLMPLTPMAAWVVVISHSIVLFLFSSTSLDHFLVSRGLPPIPLIPVSSSQAVVGAVIGIGLAHGPKGARQIRWSVLLNIASGWVSTPLIACVIGFVSLFVVQNVFDQLVYRPVRFELSAEGLEHLERSGIDSGALRPLVGQRIASAVTFRNELRRYVHLDLDAEGRVIATARVEPSRVRAETVAGLDPEFLSEPQLGAVRKLVGRSFTYRWELEDALSKTSDTWGKKPRAPVNKAFNQALQQRLDYVADALREGAGDEP